MVESYRPGQTGSKQPLVCWLEVPVVEFAHMAQVVEHSLGKGEVTGSNPVVGTIILLIVLYRVNI